MIGYHYTSLKNWGKIQKTGLIPHLIRNEAMNFAVRGVLGYAPDIYGTWIWERRQVDLLKWGHVLMVSGRHGKAKTVVELQIEYYPWDLYQLPKSRKRPDAPKRIHITHEGTVDLGYGKIKYHENEPVNIIGQLIPVERIVLLGTYDKKQALEELRNHYLT